MPGAWEIVANRKVLAYSLHTETVPMAFATSLRKLIIPGEYITLTGMPFDHARNMAVYQLLSSPFEWLFSIDSDVAVQPDCILRLLSRNLPLISGLYSRRSPPHCVPVMIRNGTWVTNYVPGSLVEVDWCGAGMLLVHRSIFESMPHQRPGKPWFDWRVDLKGLGIYPDDRCLSEDFTFNQAVKQHLGISTYVDTAIVGRHLGYSEYTHGKVEPLNHNAA